MIAPLNTSSDSSQRPVSKSITAVEHKVAVLRKFYGGERKPYYHDFAIENGVCRNCNTFIGDATMRMCSVITADEVALFRYEP